MAVSSLALSSASIKEKMWGDERSVTVLLLWPIENSAKFLKRFGRFMIITLNNTSQDERQPSPRIRGLTWKIGEIATFCCVGDRPTAVLCCNQDGKDVQAPLCPDLVSSSYFSQTD